MTQSEVITAKLEAALVYACIVAGKSARFTDAVMSRLHEKLEDGETYFGMFTRLLYHEPLGLYPLLFGAKAGNYRKLERCFKELVQAQDLDLQTCTPDDLEKIHGIGPKTSRFFILWTRPGARYAALDVHILRWLRLNGYPDAPRSTPPGGPAYQRWEQIFLAEADARGLTARELDRQIWDAGSGYSS
jgi:endonuclease III